MSKPMIRIHNVETDEIIDRVMTDDEYAIHLEQSANLESLKTEAKNNSEAKAALLDRLGITADEAKLLLS